jgi:hypothetical protein
MYTLSSLPYICVYIYIYIYIHLYVILRFLCRILGSHSGSYGEYRFLGYNTVDFQRTARPYNPEDSASIFHIFQFMI